ncbi:MAG TPA: hypothetical protein V6C97_31275 [Oculatellaceae cyanobacterium]
MFDGIDFKAAGKWIQQESNVLCDFVAKESNCASAWMKEHHNLTNWAISGLSVVGLSKCGAIGQELEVAEAKIGQGALGESLAVASKEGNALPEEIAALEQAQTNGLIRAAGKTRLAVRGAYNATLGTEHPGVVQNLIGKYQDLHFVVPTLGDQSLVKVITHDHIAGFGLGAPHAHVVDPTLSWWKDEKSLQALTKKIKLGHIGS